LLWRVRLEGVGHLPASGPAILAANHVSFFDSVVLILAVRRPISFVGKAEYLHSWKTRRLLPALGMIPLDRRGNRQMIEAFNAAEGVLRSGGLFAIYPEGTRSRDGKLHPGHTGAAHIAVTTGVPIIPVGIMGTDRVQPPGVRLPRPFRPVNVSFGPPINPADYQGTRVRLRRVITADLMAAIQVLSHQASSTASPPAAPSLVGPTP